MNSHKQSNTSRLHDLHKHATKLPFISHLKDSAFVLTGILMASIGLKGFLFPNNFLDGGATGISLLTQLLTGANLSLIIICVNLPFMYLAARLISKTFAIKSTISIIGLALLVQIIHIGMVTEDKLLIAVFGGFFLGAGIGLAIRGGSVIDGTEVLAIFISKRSSLTVGDVIALINICIFSLAALLVSIETAMYSMLTYVAASKTVDFIINGIEEYIGVMIVSDYSEEIKNQIVNNIGRGVTILKAEKGYGRSGEKAHDGKVLFCVVTRLEVTKLLSEIELIDTESFVVQYPIKDTKGGMIKKRPLH